MNRDDLSFAETPLLTEQPQSSFNAVEDSEGVDRTLEEEHETRQGFFANLAETLSESTLTHVVSDILEGVQRDQESRQEWVHAYREGLKNLGFSLEDKDNLAFKNACGAFDTTLSQSVLRLYSLAQAEMFPPEGPVNVRIMGETSESLDDQAARVKAWMNWFLTQKDLEYYADSDRLLMYLGLVGCAFRKVFQDPVEHHPVARFIDPQDFIVNNECISVLSSDRLTHVLRLDKQELMLRQKNGFYRKLEVFFDGQQPELDPSKAAVEHLDGVQPTDNPRPSLLTVYESHVHLILEEEFEDGMPRPYIVTVIPTTRQILSIRRNWQEKDKAFRRIEYFVQYNLLPGFGLYGLGYARLLGSNADALTRILRQLIDKGVLSNFPGGLRSSRLKIKDNDKLIGPCEFREVQTGGRSIQETIMPLPYGEPSMVLKELYETLRRQTQELSATLEIQVADQSMNTPVGTTLAHMDVAHRLQSAILRSLRTSLTHELGILYRLFGQCMPDHPYPFEVAGQRHMVMAADFNESLVLAPVSDPSLSTSTQRIARVQELLRLCSMAPQLFDLRAVYKRACKTLQIENIDEIMPPPQEVPSCDPVTENANAMKGLPIKVYPWQDDDAHIITHSPFAEENPQIKAHIQDHQASKYLKEMQQKMGIELPPLDALQNNPELENHIALMAAQVAGQGQQQTQAQQPPDPNAVMMADIQAREEAARLKFEEAQLKAKTEAFKAQLKFESEQQKRTSQQEIAEEKNATALEVEAMKHGEGEAYGQAV